MQQIWTAGPLRPLGRVRGTIGDWRDDRIGTAPAGTNPTGRDPSTAAGEDPAGSPGDVPAARGQAPAARRTANTRTGGSCPLTGDLDRLARDLDRTFGVARVLRSRSRHEALVLRHPVRLGPPYVRSPVRPGR